MVSTTTTIYQTTKHSAAASDIKGLIVNVNKQVPVSDATILVFGIRYDIDTISIFYK